MTTVPNFGLDNSIDYVIIYDKTNERYLTSNDSNYVPLSNNRVILIQGQHNILCEKMGRWKYYELSGKISKIIDYLRDKLHGIWI